jgi:hypothetical protein
MPVSEQELDIIFETAVAIGEQTIASTRIARTELPPRGTLALEEQVESAIAVIDQAAAALPMEKSLQLLDLRETLVGTSDEAVEPLHVVRGVILGLLWSTSLWLVIIAIALWILVFTGVRF